MSISIPCTDETWSRIKKLLLQRGAGETSAYWQDRRNELLYERNQDGTVTVNGLYPSLKKIHWFDRNKSPGPIARIRAWCSPDDPRFWCKHPLVEAYQQRIKSQLDDRLVKLFPMYDLAKAYDVMQTIERYAPSGSILEIGAGGCLVAALVLNRHPSAQYCVIDLPETMPIGFLILRHLFPQLSIALPGEAIDRPRVRFCTPEEKPDGLFGAVVNVASFQELDPPIVNDYFLKIDEALVDGGVFVCINREEKIDPMRKLRSVFKEYPWPQNYETLLDDEALISRWSGPEIAVLRRVICKQSRAE
ncbi:MAG: hypothetical protein COA65_01650 [Rhodospirillaceae bacterium]|nr:MAG: hypothetical protein COA65_01650 [Rhodospirillaceae bacterium]